jgi:hypothetical protein
VLCDDVLSARETSFSQLFACFCCFFPGGVDIPLCTTFCQGFSDQVLTSLKCMLAHLPPSNSPKRRQIVLFKVPLEEKRHKASVYNGAKSYDCFNWWQLATTPLLLFGGRCTHQRYSFSSTIRVQSLWGKTLSSTPPCNYNSARLEIKQCKLNINRSVCLKVGVACAPKVSDPPAPVLPKSPFGVDRGSLIPLVVRQN